MAEPKTSKELEDQLFEKITKQISEAMETRAPKGAYEKIADQLKGLDGFKDVSLDSLRSLLDPEKGVMKMLAEQSIKLQELEKGGGTKRDMSLRGQIRSWQEENKEALQRVVNKQSKDVPVLSLRAVASPMLKTNTIVGSTDYVSRTVVESGINDYLRAANTFWNSLVKGRTNAENYIWVNKTNPQGAAGFIGPGVAKPGISFQFESENSHAKKIADSAKASTEILQDIEGMATFIEQELREAVYLKLNTELMTGAESTTNPKGVQKYSTLYTLTTVKTANPNYMDALRAVVAQLRSGRLVGEITIYINPIDSANMDMAKASTSGMYLLPPFVTADGKNVAGANVVEDANVPVGSIQAGFMRFYRILIYKDFEVSWGWENDDFTKNLVTAIGEMRLHQFVNSIYSDSGAFLFDTYANIIAAITAA